LTPKLAQLLEEFIRHPNELVTRRQLMLNVWKTEYIGDTRTLDVHIRWVREQIEENPTKPQLLRTIRGKGYIFIMPSAETK
jgi:two-component system phosphate regulon response regulator PhoB